MHHTASFGRSGIGYMRYSHLQQCKYTKMNTTKEKLNIFLPGFFKQRKSLVFREKFDKTTLFAARKLGCFFKSAHV